MRIERVLSTEARRLVPLNAVVQELHAGKRPDIFRKAPDQHEVAAFFADLLLRPSYLALVAVSQDRADLGYALCEILETPADVLTHPRVRGVLHHIAVVPEARRQGVARRLVEAAKDEFRDRGATEWTASYHVWNDASAALLERAGLRPTIIRAEGLL